MAVESYNQSFSAPGQTTAADKSLPIEDCASPYKLIAHTLREEIEKGRYAAGERIPSLRDLASRFEVSHPTVLRAVQDLLGQNYLRAVKGKGLFVTSSLMGSQSAAGGAHGTVEAASHIESNDSSSTQFGAPHPDHLPLRQWHKLISTHSRVSHLMRASYTRDPAGSFELRNAIAGQLRRSCSVDVGAHQIIVTSGTASALRLVNRLLLAPGDKVAIEAPGSAGLMEPLTALGADVRVVPLDAEGIDAASLRRENFRMAIVSQRNSSAGTVLSAERAQEVLRIAHECGTFVLEDAFDSAFSYSTKIPLSLLTLSPSENVLHMGGFWKTLFPLVNMSYLVVPESLAQSALMLNKFCSDLPSAVEQASLAELLGTGEYERFVWQTRRSYVRKRELLISALMQVLGRDIEISNGCGSLHQVVTLLNVLEKDVVVASARQSDLPLAVASSVGASEPHAHDFSIGFAVMPEHQIFARVLRFAQELYSAKAFCCR